MRRVIGLFLVLGLSITGCGGDSTATSEGPQRFGPHGGPLVEFTEAKALVEIVSEAAAASGKERRAVIAAYFYQPDLKASFPDKPANVEVNIRTPDSPELVKLAMTPQPGKLELDKNRLVSAAGDYMMDQLAGEITVDIGGRAETKKFSGGR